MDGGRTVYALLHDEFHGFEIAGDCSADPWHHGLCQMFAITSAVSVDGGTTFQHTRPPPEHLVAAVDHRYVGDDTTLWFGWGDTGGIVRSPRDGYFYTTAHNRATIGPQINGTCLMRTDDLENPSSWRGECCRQCVSHCLALFFVSVPFVFFEIFYEVTCGADMLPSS